MNFSNFFVSFLKIKIWLNRCFCSFVIFNLLKKIDTRKWEKSQINRIFEIVNGLNKSDLSCRVTQKSIYERKNWTWNFNSDLQIFFETTHLRIYSKSIFLFFALVDLQVAAIKIILIINSRRNILFVRKVCA